MIDFYKLKYIHRYTSNVRIHTENVAEHSFFVSCIVLQIANLNPQLDLGKALTMALTHDWAEAWITDVSHKVKRDYPGIRKEIKHAEYLVIKEHYPEYSDLLNELDEGTSLEANVVHYADVAQCIQYIRNEISLGNNTIEFEKMLEESLARETQLISILKRYDIKLYEEKLNG